MADLNSTRTVRAGAKLTNGMLVYNNERHGLVASLARFLHKRFHWGFLERMGYEVLPAVDEKPNPIVGIAVEDSTPIGNGLHAVTITISTPFGDGYPHSEKPWMIDKSIDKVVVIHDEGE